MLRITHANAATMMNRAPGPAAGGVQQRIEQRPVGPRIRAVAHRLGFGIGTGDRTGVEVVAADHDGSTELAPGHHLIEGQAEAMPVAQADPADARRQPLELDALGGHVEPVVQMWIVGNELTHFLVSAKDILRIPGQRHPPEGTDATAEQWPDILRHESRDLERVADALLQRNLTDVVAVVEGRYPAELEFQHGAHVRSHRGVRRGGYSR